MQYSPKTRSSKPRTLSPLTFEAAPTTGGCVNSTASSDDMPTSITSTWERYAAEGFTGLGFMALGVCFLFFVVVGFGSDGFRAKA